MDYFKDFSSAVNWIEEIVPFGINLGVYTKQTPIKVCKTN